MKWTLADIWTGLAFASIIAFVLINVFVAKKYDIYKKSPYQAEQKK